jgi:hypothetical protein
VTRGAIAFVLGVLSLVACTGGPSGTDATAPGEHPMCEVGFRAPAGFRPLEAFREDYADHVGLRLGFRDEQRRELHAFAGIPGEFGEGLPLQATVELARGVTGWLVGRGRVWFLTWREGGLCDPHAVLGNGFRRKEFLAVMEEAGIVVAE